MNRRVLLGFSKALLTSQGVPVRLPLGNHTGRPTTSEENVN